MKLFINFIKSLFKKNTSFSKNKVNKSKKLVLPNLIFEKK